MPFKSKAQRRKFAQLLVQGKISKETFGEWNRETGGKKLPERVSPYRRATKRRQETCQTKNKQESSVSSVRASHSVAKCCKQMRMRRPLSERDAVRSQVIDILMYLQR